jgi:ADP-ribose pyrophosphatase YjhB (NUDIX family)
VAFRDDLNNHEVLLVQRRSPCGSPGRPGEPLAACPRREVHEETNLRIEPRVRAATAAPNGSSPVLYTVLAQARHTRLGGYCPPHTWQYAAIASPIGIAVGNARLAGALADALAAELERLPATGTKPVAELAAAPPHSRPGPAVTAPPAPTSPPPSGRPPLRPRPQRTATNHRRCACVTWPWYWPADLNPAAPPPS